MREDIDLRGIESSLNNIANGIDRLSAPLQEYYEDSRHAESLELQQRQHKELLSGQQSFNNKLLKEYKKQLFWTRVLVITTTTVSILAIVLH